MRAEGTPNENWADIDLLDCVDDALRNGRLMTRGNLAFDFLCQRLGFDRHQLPGYVADMQKLEKEDESPIYDLYYDKI
jgi:hypothetical protein